MNIDIKKKLSENAELIENVLSEIYRADDADISALVEAERYAVLGGGKRIRAFLVMSVARLLGAPDDAALPYAAAIEIMHASSLVHDDMPCMDDDAMRRGKPATHVRFGETLALIAGDAMMMKAMEVALSNPCLPSPANAEAALLLASSAGDSGMLAGQTMDTVSADTITKLDELIKLHSLKTGKLIRASVILACIAARVEMDDPRRAALIEYADGVGLAFQIIDDVLDYESGEREKNSFLAFMSTDQAKEYARGITESAKDAIREYDDGTLCALADLLTVRKY